MGVRFSKSIKLGDLFKINISKSGVSATIGKKGASVNLGSKGTYLNLSPTIAGITGTGVSYRKKITGGYGSLLNKLTGKNEKNDDAIKEKIKDSSKAIDNKSINEADIIQEYENNLNASINIHKLSENVITEKEFENKIEKESNTDLKEIYNNCFNGNEETIESLIGSFMMNLDFAYPVKANYELENDVLYVDLDLPEIEQLIQEYPTQVKDKIINKKKTQGLLKQEYAYTVMSLSAYLSAQFFNISSFIKTIAISGFTTLRNKEGDLVDEYLYSIKYTRNEFENTDLSKVDSIYDFILKFDNRINFNESSYTFKQIKPFEMQSQLNQNNYIDDAVLGLKELGYKSSIIDEIMPELSSIKLESSSEYLKEALKLIANHKN